MDRIPPCAACKHLRKKCSKECKFALYFPTNKQADYAAVHKVFGASHVAALLNVIHPSQREFAMNSLAFEAQVRLVDPVCGCTGIIYRLNQQLIDLQEQLAIAKNELASYGINTTFEPQPPLTYRQTHNNPMIPATPNHGGCLTAQQLHDDAQRFISTQTAQMQQTQETQMQQTQQTQMQHNEKEMVISDKKILSKI